MNVCSCESRHLTRIDVGPEFLKTSTGWTVAFTKCIKIAGPYCVVTRGGEPGWMLLWNAQTRGLPVPVFSGHRSYRLTSVNWAVNYLLGDILYIVTFILGKIPGVIVVYGYVPFGVSVNS